MDDETPYNEYCGDNDTPKQALTRMADHATSLLRRAQGEMVELETRIAGLKMTIENQTRRAHDLRAAAEKL